MPGSVEWRHGILVCKTTQLLFNFVVMLQTKLDMREEV